MANNQKPTEINTSVQRTEPPAKRDVRTEINGLVNVLNTVINESAQDESTNYTVVNPQAQNWAISVPTGTVLAEKYTVKMPLHVDSGEANLYICECGSSQYVAKVYRRQTASKEDVHLALADIDSPYVAKIYEFGVWNGFPFEIIPYYKYGSLAGKTFSVTELKKNIIPALNEGLRVLHEHEIIHKDLKPSNIMLCDDKKTVSIIDFGISSVREGGSTVVVTKTGMTPEYSAPETFRNLFLEESDYYSLGITIYELMTGHTPYAGLSKDVIEQYVSIQRIPFPPKFPDALQVLITGLTYNDITNRKDKNNPNRRWTYEEVLKWCKGEPIKAPGGPTGEGASADEKIPPFTFQYHKYTTVSELVKALGREWKQGKRRLYRNLLTEHFRPVNQELASFCMDAADSVQKDPGREDVEFFRVLYKLYPQMQDFFWKDSHYASMEDLGNDILEGLYRADSRVITEMGELIQNHLFSIREEIVNSENLEFAKKVARIESNYIVSVNTSDNAKQLEQIYLLGYLYSKSRVLQTSYGQFDSIQKLTDYVKRLLRSNDSELDSLSRLLMFEDSKSKAVRTTPQFSAWLTVMGMGSSIAHFSL